MVDVEIGFKLLAERLAPLEPVDLRRLTGGASSLTYAATATAGGSRRPVVVKVAPAGLEPVRNRDVLRQARLLRGLLGSGVPVPEVLFESPGRPPEEPPLFAMSFVDGTSLEPLFDTDLPDDVPDDPPAVVSDRLRHACRILADLHHVDPAAIGLGTEPVIGLLDEVERWSALLRTVDPALVPGWEDVADALVAAPPTAVGPRIVHGDFRLGNTLAVGPRVTAVIDWEIWSLGDPRIDLGWFLANADPATYERRTRYAGLLPSPADLVAEYAERSQADIADLDWFRAFACFKAAAVWASIVKHSRRRPDPDEVAEDMAQRLPHLLALARR